MKKLLLLTTLITFVVLVGCASTNAHIDPSEVEFREISSVEYSNPQQPKETLQVKNQTKVDESKTSTPTKTTLPKNNFENGSNGGILMNGELFDGTWIEADGSLQYYDALGCDVPLLEGVYYFSNDDKYPCIFFTIDGLESFIKEYNKNANTSLLNEVRFKLSNLSFTKLQEALISEKQFTFIQLSRMSMLDLDYIFNETSEMFKNTISYCLIVMPYNNTPGYQLATMLLGYVHGERYVSMALLSNANTWRYCDVSEY